MIYGCVTLNIRSIEPKRYFYMLSATIISVVINTKHSSSRIFLRFINCQKHSGNIKTKATEHYTKTRLTSRSSQVNTTNSTQSKLHHQSLLGFYTTMKTLPETVIYMANSYNMCTQQNLGQENAK